MHVRERIQQAPGLLLRQLSVISTVRAGFALHPDDPDDPYVFRMSLRKRLDALNPTRLAGGAAAAGAAGLAVHRYRTTHD